jgi:hypothetical protein
VCELNDIHIFVRQALPLLEEAKATHAASSNKKDRRYYVPSTKRTKFARRTDQELKTIYETFTSRRLYEAFLIAGIGEFENFLARVLREVFRQYPKKLGTSVSGVPACKTASLDTVLASTTVEEVLERTIDEHLRNVFFASPRAYFDYFSKAVGTDIADDAYLDYYELKATRDLLVHTDRVANPIYIEKAGARARFALGHTVTVDSDYFDAGLATMKRISGIIKRDAAKAFPVLEPAA